MKYNFDEKIDRSDTAAVKVEGLKQLYGRDDLLPLWVADMDFATPPFIIESVEQRLRKPILGYTDKSDGYYNAIINWNKRRYDMDVTREMIHFVPGIVPGIVFALNAFTEPGDKVMIMPPVYHPFSWSVTRNNRRLVECPLILEDGRYRMDLETFRRNIKGIRAFILCNPHNPGGIVWSRDELETIADICADDNVLVIADEIHADLTLPPHRHLPFAMISDKARKNSVTFMAPSKAFNMPGLAASHAIIFNHALAKRFAQQIEANMQENPNVFACAAVEAAYTKGEEWLEQCLDYIQGNIRYVDEFLKTHMPYIVPMIPDASFLIWLDCRLMGLSQTELVDFFVNEARLGLNDGSIFGSNGVGFMRLNVGSPRAVLEEAMQRLLEAYRRRMKA